MKAIFLSFSCKGKSKIFLTKIRCLDYFIFNSVSQLLMVFLFDFYHIHNYDLKSKGNIRAHLNEAVDSV